MSPLHPDEETVEPTAAIRLPFLDPNPSQPADPGAVQQPTGNIPLPTGPIPAPTPADRELHVDLRAMTEFRDNGYAWASALREVLGHATDTWVDIDDLHEFFDAFAQQVRAGEARTIAFSIANTPIAEVIAGDAPIVALRMRDSFANQTLARTNRS